MASPPAVTIPLPAKALPSFVIVAVPAEDVKSNNTTPPSLVPGTMAPVIDDCGVRRIGAAEEKQVARVAAGRDSALVDELPAAGLRGIVKNVRPP